MRGQRPPARGPAPAMLAHGRLARVHLDRLGDRAGLVGELLEGELQLPRIDAFGFLAEQPLTEHVELMAQRRVLALRLRELVLQRGDQGPRRGEIGDVGPARVRHARMIRERRSAVQRPTITRRARTSGGGASAPGRRPTSSSARSVLRISTGLGRLVRRPRERPLLEPLVEDPEPGSIPRQDLQAVAAPIPKQKQMAGQRIQREALTHERRQAHRSTAADPSRPSRGRSGPPATASASAIAAPSRRPAPDPPTRPARRAGARPAQHDLDHGRVGFRGHPHRHERRRRCHLALGLRLVRQLAAPIPEGPRRECDAAARSSPCDSPLARHCATRRAMRAGVRLLIIARILRR